MSAVDPLAALAAAGDADIQALIDGELAQLAADAQSLRGLLVEDAVVTARVLPSNGLTDLIEIAGRRVAASLPPTVRPGDVLQVRVTGFDGDRILLQIVGTGADAAVETGPPNVPIAPSPAAFVAASIQPAAPPVVPGTPVAPGTSAAPAAPPVPATGPAASPAPAAGPAPVAGTSSPPGGAAAAPEAAPAAIPFAVPPGRPGVGAAFASVVSRANVAPPVPPQAGERAATPPPGAPLRAAVAVQGEPSSIEARLATARAAVAQSAAAPDAESPHVAPAAFGGAQRFVAPPQISTKTIVPAAPRASALAAYAEPVALLRALRLPVTPSNVASATLALQHPDRLPDALAALERALPRASDDPHVATLRTLLSFVGRIDPRSPALASQIAAYVDHVVDGAEPKLATLLAAAHAATPPSDPGASAAPPHARGGQPDSPPLPAAVAAERGAALSADLKQTLLAVAANPATPESLGPSLAGALTALTAVQVGAAQALAAQPDGLAFTIPLATPHGTSNAHISVKRDAPESRGRAQLDSENFRIAFVLDTAHYGTVAIDLVTVGRDVTVDVRTEAASSMRAFRDALGTLTSRLESLRYRVASAGASVGTTSTIAVEAPPSRPADPDAAVDRSA